jgi:hypothetical protein
MTVGELIQTLLKMPADCPVVVPGTEQHIYFGVDGFEILGLQAIDAEEESYRAPSPKVDIAKPIKCVMITASAVS